MSDENQTKIKRMVMDPPKDLDPGAGYLYERIQFEHPLTLANDQELVIDYEKGIAKVIPAKSSALG